MIIKPIRIGSNSAKVIEGVLNYVGTDRNRIKTDEHALYFNIHPNSREELAKEFKRNYDDFATPQNRTPIRHIIFSPNPASRPHMTHEIMDDLMREYLRQNFPNSMAYGQQHVEGKWHGHIVLSGNDLCSQKSTRMSKKELHQAYFNLLKYMEEKYPQLEIGIDLENYGKRLHSEKEYYKRKRNPNLNLTRDELSKTVSGLFKLSENSKDFKKRLTDMGLKTYDYQGKLMGVFFGDDNRKMRFSRLGISKELFKELDKQDDRLKELEQLRDDNDEREVELDR